MSHLFLFNRLVQIPLKSGCWNGNVILLQAITYFWILWASGASAGWVSSGGELFKDAHNPWFLRNVNEVRYCVLHSSSVSQGKEQIQSIIQWGIRFWKNEFDRVQLSTSSRGSFHVGTQTFQEVNCDSPFIDLRFLFGYETLSETERAYLKDPQKYIGITVRTDYDEVNLRGKGFIFISSDIGSYAYHRAGDLIEKAWQHTRLLQYVLLHELGHVFGFPHAGGGLMSEVFLEQILNQKTYQNFLNAQIEAFLVPESVLEICSLNDSGIKQWFGAPTDASCLRLEQQPQNGSYDVYFKKSSTSAPVLLGKFRGLQPNLFDFRSKPGCLLQLTDQQTVFSGEEAAFRKFMNGPMVTDLGGSSTFIPKTTALPPKTVYIRITSNSFTIFGTVGSQVKPVFLYNSPLAILLAIIP